MPSHTINPEHDRIHACNSSIQGYISPKNLLQDFLFCSNCGCKLKPWTSGKHKIRYYKHPVTRTSRCSFGKYLKAKELEASVIIIVLKALCDSDLGRSERSIPIRMNRIEQEPGILTDANKIKKAGKWLNKLLADSQRQDSKCIMERSYKWKRNLLEMALSGNNIRGEQNGVHISADGDQYRLDLKNNFFNVSETFPLTDEFIENEFSIDSDFSDDEVDISLVRLLISR